jgi:RNA polymerase sigma-70 factor (sigma-E family)
MTRSESPSIEIEPSSTGDPDDWLDAAFRRDYGPLVRLATLLVDREVAEELVQDAFVRTHGRLSRVAPGKVSVYLRSAVINGARSHLRRRMVQRRHLPPPPPLAVAAEVGGVAAAERTEVFRALDALPNRQREVLLLRYYLDLSENEIAETLGISTGSVKQHAHRGLAALAATLGGQR